MANIAGLLSEGTITAFNRLLDIYLGCGKNSEKAHDALMSIPRTNLINILHSKLIQTKDNTAQKMILQWGYSLDRKTFLFFIMVYAERTNTWQDFNFQEDFKQTPLSIEEKIIIYKFMDNYQCYYPFLFSELTPFQRQEITKKFQTTDTFIKLKSVNQNPEGDSKPKKITGFPLIQFQNVTTSILPINSTLIDYLFSTLQQIKIQKFYCGSGYINTEGLQTLEKLFKFLKQNNKEAEIIAGCLQNYHQANQQNIYKSTAEILNNFMKNGNTKLYTCRSLFFHGNFFFLKGKIKSILIIGSSNISQTSLCSSYGETNISIGMHAKSNDENLFLSWYDNLKKNCNQLQLLNLTLFPQKKEEEKKLSQPFKNKSWEILSSPRASSLISGLTNKEVRDRLNLWMRYNPDKIYKKLGIHSLPEYMFFWYPFYQLAVFESFQPNNAFFVFKTSNYENLFEELRPLTKSQMMAKSVLKYHGYHVESFTNLKERVSSLFGY